MQVWPGFYGHVDALRVDATASRRQLLAVRYDAHACCSSVISQRIFCSQRFVAWLMRAACGGVGGGAGVLHYALVSGAKGVARNRQ